MDTTKAALQKTTETPAYSTKDINTIQQVRLRLFTSLHINIQCINSTRDKVERWKKSLENKNTTDIERFVQLDEVNSLRSNL